MRGGRGGLRRRIEDGDRRRLGCQGDEGDRVPVGACGQVRRPPHRREASPDSVMGPRVVGEPVRSIKISGKHRATSNSL